VQLADNVEALKQTISAAITERSDIANRPLREQWQHIILRPLSKLGDSSSQDRYILVVDALDERDEYHIKTVLQLLVTAHSLETVQLRVFIISRPEGPIQNGFIEMD
jgi:hypothetical protein